MEYRVCTRCVMDTTASEITFDQHGVCSFCRHFDSWVKPALERAKGESGRRRLAEIVKWIRATGKGQAHDSILALSGGVDSSYLAHLVVEHGLRPLVVHVDMGWNTSESSRNVKRLVEKLGFPMKTIVVDFDVMRRIQIAFYKAAVRNCEIPQDHAFLAVLYREASQRGIRAILTGGNLATESILPRSWGFNTADVRHLRAIHRRFGEGTLKGFPTLGVFHRYIYYPFVRKIQEVRLLNFVPYDREQAKDLLTATYQWMDYGPKHFESVLTRFYQGYYLPEKFGIDKRKAHFSSLILSGQMTREEALAKLEEPPYLASQLEEDIKAIADALGLSIEDWRKILAHPVRAHESFPSQSWLFTCKNAVVHALRTRQQLRR